MDSLDLGDFVSVRLEAGSSHTCAISDERKLKCWGLNWYGQLGLGDINNRGNEIEEMGDFLLIIDLGSNFVVKEVFCGCFHTCVLSAIGYIKCFGYGLAGPLGYGNTSNVGDESNEMGDFLDFVDLGSDFNVSRLGKGSTAHQ